jgi:membrane-bound serine protease (ClpP class)
VPVVLLTAAALGGCFVWIIGKAVQARHAEVHTGSEELIGAHGEVRSPLAPLGHVFVKGALWRARSEQGGIRVGDEVVVENVDGLTLTVAPAPERPEGTAEGVQSAT